jgi:hypothetical protein
MDSPPVAHEPANSETKRESSPSKPTINNEHGATMKDDKAAIGTFKQNELQQKLAASKAQPMNIHHTPEIKNSTKFMSFVTNTKIKYRLNSQME